MQFGELRIWLFCSSGVKPAPPYPRPTIPPPHHTPAPPYPRPLSLFKILRIFKVTRCLKLIVAYLSNHIGWLILHQLYQISDETTCTLQGYEQNRD
jgi:hypothetical protein